MADAAFRGLKGRSGDAEQGEARRTGIPGFLFTAGRWVSQALLWVLRRNRRRHDRHPCEFPVQLHLESPGSVQVVEAVARNISNHGMLLQCVQLPKVNSLCLLEFGFPQWSAPGRDEVKPVSIRAEIRHSEPALGTFGVAFAIPLGVAVSAVA